MKNKDKNLEVQVETIDCTPSWVSILPVYLHVLQESANVQAVDSAQKEMMRMAKAADSFNDLIKDYKNLEQQSVDAIATLLKLVDCPTKAITPSNKKILDEIRQIVKDHYDNAKTKADSDQGLVESKD